MAKKDEPWKGQIQDTSLPLKKRVETWLQHSGYPLEYRTAHILRPHNFMAMNGLYVPPDDASRNGMELDVVATFQKAPINRVRNFAMICECKTIPAPRAWVVMQDPHPNPVANAFGIPATALCDHAQKKFSNLFDTAKPISDGVLGQCIRTLHPDGDSPDEEKDKDKTNAFSAVSQLVRRVISFLRLADNEGPVSLIAVPVLVVQGELARARWESSTMSFIAEPLTHAWVNWAGHQGWRPYVFTFAVVHIDALDAFTHRVANWANEWCPAMDTALKSLPPNLTNKDVPPSRFYVPAQK